MKTILLATDFSDAASNAARYAVDMARAISANLVLLHIYRLPVSYSEIPIPVAGEELKQDAEKNLELLKEDLSRRTSDAVSISTIVREGFFLIELENICEEEHPYMVVMGSQGTTATERLIFGTHALQAIKQLHWPVITVPPGSVFSKIRKIGLACDFNKVVETVPVDEIKELVTEFHAELHILNMAPRRQFDPEMVFEAGVLQEMIKDLEPEYHFIASGDTDEGIISFTETNKIDLLVVFPKRHGLVDRLLHRSHSKQLVLHSHVPVISLQAK